MSLTVGFVTNQLGLRGTETVLWAYAHYNEVMLGNKSLIFVKNTEEAIIQTYNIPDRIREGTEWFKSRFGKIFYCDDTEIENRMKEVGVDVCFIELGGSITDWVPVSIPSVLHCVFTPLLKGTISTGISECVARQVIPVLPNIMPSYDTTDCMREELGIPKDAIVFGRYGGYKQFSLNFAKDAVKHVAENHPNRYFLFMNTEEFMEPRKNVIFLPGTRDLYRKQKFINACDAYLHARDDGETFGAAVGEFALCNKNIIAPSPRPGYEVQHLVILGDKCIQYIDYDDLVDILINYPDYKKDMTDNGYYKYTPEKVIPRFSEFLHDAIRIHNK